MSAAPCPRCGSRDRGATETTERIGRPPLFTLGDCLEETARQQPHGFTKLTYADAQIQGYCPDNFESNKPWLDMGAATACIAPATVTIYILAGTAPATARDVLKEAAKFLKQFDTLADYTPTKPPAAADSEIQY